MSLTAKQEAFAVLVAKGMSAADAYAGAYASKGSQTARRVEGNKLLKNPTVSLRVEVLRAPAVALVQQQVTVDLTRVLFENARLGFADLRRAFDPVTGELKKPSEWDDDMAAAISSVKVRKLFGDGKDGVGEIGTVTEIKLWDKGAALDRLMKHLGGYEKDNEQKGGLLDGVDRNKVRAIVEAIDAIGSKRLGKPAPRALGVASG